MRTTAAPSLIPTSRVAVYEGFSSMCQFRGVEMTTRGGEHTWHERADGMLVTTGLTGGKYNPLATWSLVIDRERRRMTFTQREQDGSVHISHNMAREKDEPSWGRKPGDVDMRFYELVDTVLAQITRRSA